jgi:hypothetical protein
MMERVDDENHDTLLWRLRLAVTVAIPGQSPLKNKGLCCLSLSQHLHEIFDIILGIMNRRNFKGNIRPTRLHFS